MRAFSIFSMILMLCIAFVAFAGAAYAQTAVSFSANVTSGVAPLAVQFTDQSNGSTAWQWNFGDGTSNSTLQNPVHVFTNVSSYDVTLTITTASGQQTLQKTGYINVQLAISGAVGNPSDLSMSDLQALPLITENVSYTQHGSNMSMNVTGVSLNALLNKTSLDSSATSVTFTGSDNYNTTIPLSTIQADPNSIIAFSSPTDGTLMNVIPSQGMSRQWVYDLVSLTVNSQSASVTASPSMSMTTSPTATTAPTATPSPAPGSIIVMILIGAVCYVAYRKQ